IRELIAFGTAIQSMFPDSAMAIFQHTLSRSELLLFHPGIVASRFRLGNIYAGKGWHEQGIQTLKEAIPYCYALKDHQQLLSIAYNDIGIIYQAMGNYDLASRLYYYAIWLAEQSPPSAALSRALNNFGAILIYLKRSDQALP